MENYQYYPKYFYDESGKRYLYCEKCDIELTKDMEHCDDCQVCVHDFDHHCIFYSKCIAKGNVCTFYAAFIGLMVNFFIIMGTLMIFPGGVRK